MIKNYKKLYGAAVLLISTFITGYMVHPLLNKNKPDHSYLPCSVNIYGVAKDQPGGGIPNAELFVLAVVDGDTLGIGRTNARGKFDFIVKTNRDESRVLIVKQKGAIGFSGYFIIDACRVRAHH